MINGNHFSLILLSTNQCNAACDYCFEAPTADRLSLDRLQTIIDKVLQHMEAHQIDALTIHWQGGEAMLLPPSWYAQAFALIRDAAAAHGKQVEHGLQTNMLAYNPDWDEIIDEMFGNSLSTSLHYPNRHRKLAGQSPEHYDRLWTQKVQMAREAGIDIKVISLVNQGTLEIGAELFYTHLVNDRGITDFQINTPFPGGEANRGKQSLCLEPSQLAHFHVELADIWLERGLDQGVQIGPFDQLLDFFSHRDSALPCIWGRNCADEFIAIDARGHVAQCDCWVTSYPDYRFGNLFESDSLSALLSDSSARKHFNQRPVKLMQGDCLQCDYLAMCHGGCPVRTYSMHQNLFDKDPYCQLYQSLFQHMESRASQVAADTAAIIDDNRKICNDQGNQ